MSRWAWTGVALVAVAAATIALRACARHGDDGSLRAGGDAADIADVAPRRGVPRVHVPAPLPYDAVRATVRSMTGEPIPGAVVALFRGPESGDVFDDDDFRPSAKPPEPVRTASADGGGGALFDGLDNGRWFVAGWAPGYGRRVVNVTRGPRGTDVDVFLAAGAPFAGSLRDDAGAPLAGVDVILAPTQRSLVWPSDAACLRTTTDAAGAWVFDSVAPGEYRVWVRAEPEALADEGRVRVPSLDRLDIRLARGACVEGVVTDADTGRALPGARVEIRSDLNEVPVLAWTTCDGAGQFSYLTHLAKCDVNSVRVDADGYAPIPVADSGDVPLKHARDGQVVRLVVRVRRGFAVEGVVTGPEGPRSGAEVKVVPESEMDAGRVDGRQAKTDATGRYRLERLPAGPATVFVNPFDSTRYWRTDVKAPVVVGEAPVATADVTIVAKRVVTAGRVVDRDGNPIAGASVTYESGPLGSSTVTGSDGRYSLAVWILPDQDYPSLAVRGDAFGRGDGTVPADGGEAEDVQLRPLATEHGAILDADGRPVPGTRVVVESGGAGQECFIWCWPGAVELVTDAHGAFEVTASTGDEELIHPYSPTDGTAWNWRFWDRDPDGKRDISLRRVVRARGRVLVAGTHDPVAAALVRYSWYGGQKDPAAVGRTRADGGFDVPYEPAEEKEVHGLRISADGFIAETLTPGDADAVLELRPAFAITGTLVDADGRPIADQDVTAKQTSVQDDVAASDSCTTDSDGRFVFPSLPAGRYEVAASASKHEFEDVSAEIVAGTRDVVLAAGKAASEEKKPEEEPREDDEEK